MKDARRSRLQRDRGVLALPLRSRPLCVAYHTAAVRTEKYSMKDARWAGLVGLSASATAYPLSASGLVFRPTGRASESSQYARMGVPMPLTVQE